MQLKADIYTQFKLPISIGIAPSKWIAKVATEKAKPFGVHHVQNIHEFIQEIPINEFPGIGKAFQQRLLAHNIKRLGEVEAHKDLFYSWGKIGIQLYERITGTDQSITTPKSSRKSIGISRTFDPICDTTEIRRRVAIMARHIVYMVIKHQVNPQYLSQKNPLSDLPIRTDSPKISNLGRDLLN